MSVTITTLALIKVSGSGLQCRNPHERLPEPFTAAASWASLTTTTATPHSSISLVAGFFWGYGGSKRIRDELRKLGYRLTKRTVAKYMRQVRPTPPPRKPNQTWSIFLNNHRHQVWACDFLQTYDLWFRTLFVFFIIELGSRRVVYFAVTSHPTDAWVAQQLREAAPFDIHPRFLIRDNDRKYGAEFERAASGIEILRTPVHAPKANAVCERFVGSVRRECLDHMIVLNERHLHRVIREYVAYFNTTRPHQGISGHVPIPSISSGSEPAPSGQVTPFPILGGLHHDYRWAA